MPEKSPGSADAADNDRVPTRIARADRILDEKPDLVREAATSQPALDALTAAFDALGNFKTSPDWADLWALVEFLKTLQRLDAPDRDDTELLGLLTHESDLPADILQSCQEESVTKVVCDMLRDTPVDGGLSAAVLVVEAGDVHESVGVDRKPNTCLFSDSLIDRPDVHVAELRDGDLFGGELAEPDATLPLFEDREQSGKQRFMNPAYALQLFGLGGTRASQGVAAPIELRTFLDFWRLPPDERDGYGHDFERRVEEVINNVWPYGGYDWKDTDWRRFTKAFNTITNFRLRYTTDKGVIRAFRPETFRDWPERAKYHRLKDQLIRGTITLPEGTGIGPSMSRAVLQHAGTLSGVALRLAITWAFYRAKYFMQKGWLTRPTHPRTLQNEQGLLLDHAGQVICDDRGKPITRFMDPRVVLLDEDGRCVPRLGQAARIPNPDIQRAPALTIEEWRHTLYPDLRTGSRQAARNCRVNIVRAVDLLEDSGILTAQFIVNDKPFARGPATFSWARPTNEIGVLARTGTRLRLIPPGLTGGSPTRDRLRQWHEGFLESKRAMRPSREPSPPEVQTKLSFS